ncbi:MAG: citramalate synthase, partial [Verrucomicrobiota bacterium]
EQGREVVYDAEHFFDGYKDDAEHALATLAAAKAGGADILVLCDTNGGTMPHEVEEITTVVGDRLGIPVGIHTHDDTGVGVANALASVRAGAVQVQGTVNGYGERTGNCNLTTVIPNLSLKMGYEVSPEMERLTSMSHYIDEMANNKSFDRAPYVGQTAFSHKGGMHVNAVQKLARSYEHIVPELVGNKQNILVSELSGRSNILMKAEEAGIDLQKDDPKVRTILEELKSMEKEGYEFEAAEASFELLVRQAVAEYEPFFKLLEYHCTTREHPGSDFDTCEATVKLEINGERIYTVEEGDGPVNALDGALRKALVPKFPQLGKIELLDYKVRIIDGHAGTAAKTRVLITSSDGELEWGTVGVSFNIINASWKALIASFEWYLLKNGA